MRPLSIRWRLTLWYCGLLAGLLAAYSTAVFLMMRHHLVTRMDEMLAGELAEVRSALAEPGPLADKQEVLRRRFAADDRFEFEVVGSDGDIVFQSEDLQGRSLAGLIDENDRGQGFAEGNLPGHGIMRVISVTLPTELGQVDVRVAVSIEPDRKELRHLLVVIFLAGPLALAGAVTGGYWMARRAFEPIDRMVATAAELTAKRLDRRLAVVRPDDELGRLAQSFNQMIARLEQSFLEVRRFTADAAHELRTPLAIIRNQTEIALRTGRTVDEYRHVLESSLEENARLTQLAEQLLYLSREDAGLQRFCRLRVPIDELLHGVCEHMQVLAAEKHIALELNCVPAVVGGDADRLRRVFYNLLDNAIKYTSIEHAAGDETAQAGRIQVRCDSNGPDVRVTVADNGPGIAPEHVPHIFDRFYRVDPARGDAVRGIGLGLAICRSIVESHEGQIFLKSQLGVGTTVTVVLPKWDKAVVESAAGTDRPVANPEASADPK